MKFENMSTKQREMSLWKPTLRVLQEAGGKLTRSEIKIRLCDIDEEIAIYSQVIRTSKKGIQYKPFDWDFNFSLKQLSIIGYVAYYRGSPITLTDSGLEVDVDNLNVVGYEKIIEESYKKLGSSLTSDSSDAEDSNYGDSNEEEPLDNFKAELASAISKMSPKKFEAFSRQLLNKMGVEFTEKGVQISNDGRIDGYGYHTDKHDFRTTRVVIQCKRYNNGAVGEPEINQFLGAMSKNNADYGVFITNGRFTKAAKIAAREGSPITLVDGNDLIELVIKYELHISPVTTYVMDDFYSE